MILLGPAERIFDLAEKKFSQKEFAAALGVKPQRVSEWKRGLSSSYQKYISQIATILGTTTEYLLTGEGPKEKNTPADVSNSDTLDEGQLMAAFFEGGEDLSEDEMAGLWQDAKDYINWKLAQRRKANNGQ